MEAGWLHPAPVWSDVRTFDGRRFRGCVDIVTSGDPCQGNSVAGKRLGELDDRWLLDRAIDIFDQSGADTFFRENVPGNADGQLAVAIPALERLGCRVAVGIFSAAETGNTMRRERLFILARRAGGGFGERRPADREGSLGYADGRGEGCGRDVANRNSDQPASVAGDDGDGLPPAVIPGPSDNRGWIDVLDRWPELQPALSQEEAESHLRRGIDALADRVERLRATGNGVDPVAAATAFLRLDALLGLDAAQRADGAVSMIGEAA
jgi:site-specific DNA-cytosine methylase